MLNRFQRQSRTFYRDSGDVSGLSKSVGEQLIGPAESDSDF